MKIKEGDKPERQREGERSQDAPKLVFVPAVKWEDRAWHALVRSRIILEPRRRD